MDEGEIRRYSNDKKICMARVTCGCLIRVTDMKVAQVDIESPRAGFISPTKFRCVQRAQKSKYDTGGDAYDCAKEKVLVNNEPASPHHESDGVQKDFVSIHQY